ncbi:MAG: hypothetical protein RL757_2983 [Bacteroidota bacterium]
MREAENIEAVAALPIDYMGFIFYPKSARFVADFPKAALDISVKKVGVFVNDSIENILSKIELCQLSAVQLHGSESPEYVENLRKHAAKIEIFKAFSIDETFDFKGIEDYEGKIDVLLFDTKTPQHGGSGVAFDWNLLEKYDGNTPFLLAGGISAADTGGVQKMKQHPTFGGIDLNSRFEIAAGLKNVALLQHFIEQLR